MQQASRTRRTVVITHMSTDENLGDFGILLGMVHGIRRLEPDARITVISAELPGKRAWSEAQVAATQALGVTALRDPRVLARCHHGPAVGWAGRMIRGSSRARGARLVGHRARAIAHPLDRGTWDALVAADVVLAKGGSYLYSHGGLRGRDFVWRMLYLLRLRGIGRAPALMGVTRGAAPVPRHPAGCTRHTARCRQVYVRESLSAAYLARIGVGVARASDMAFLLEPPTSGARLTAPPTGGRPDDPRAAVCALRLPRRRSSRFSAVIRDTLTSLLESDRSCGSCSSSRWRPIRRRHEPRFGVCRTPRIGCRSPTPPPLTS